MKSSPINMQTNILHNRINLLELIALGVITDLSAKMHGCVSKIENKIIKSISEKNNVYLLRQRKRKTTKFTKQCTVMEDAKI